MRRVLTRLKKDDLVWLTDTDALRKAPARIEVSPRALPINRSCGEVIMTISGVVRDRRAVGPARGASYAFNQRPLSRVSQPFIASNLKAAFGFESGPTDEF